MQNLGFTFAVIPLIKSAGMNGFTISDLLNRHLQSFNTHPYMSGPVLGSVVKLEEEAHDGRHVAELKKTLMGPYAGIGDAFFWGAWRPFSAIGASVLAIQGIPWAPLMFLLIYNPAPLYVRLKGFIEGYRRGKRGIDFIGRLNLPGLAGKVRWISILLMAILAALLYESTKHVYTVVPNLLTGFIVLGTILSCFWMITRGISAIKILYGTVALFLLLSL